MPGFTPSSWLKTSVTLDKHFFSVCLSFPACGVGMVTGHTSGVVASVGISVTIYMEEEGPLVL